jgi:hypothetical protein
MHTSIALACRVFCGYGNNPFSANLFISARRSHQHVAKNVLPVYLMFIDRANNYPYFAKMSK